MLKYRFYKILRFFHLISKEKYKKSIDYKIIAGSKFFDAKWYLEHNPDVKSAKVDPVKHFVNIGWKECREWTPYFNIKEYLRMYPDIAEAGINPLLHWEKHGQFEDRYAEATPKKVCVFSGIANRIRNIMTYPQTVYDEYQKLSLELKNIK